MSLENAYLTGDVVLGHGALLSKFCTIIIKWSFKIKTNNVFFLSLEYIFSLPF